MLHHLKISSHTSLSDLVTEASPPQVFAAKVPNKTLAFGRATMNVENYPMFQQTLQFSSSR
jgi:hypothetical protein